MNPKKYSKHSDPEYLRWVRTYPRFPGVHECAKLLRSGKARGSWIDIIVGELTEHAKERLPDLVAAFRAEENDWVQLMLLMSISDSQIPEAIPFLTEVFREGHSRFAPCAEVGLKAIGTREARAALWSATHPE